MVKFELDFVSIFRRQVTEISWIKQKVKWKELKIFYHFDIVHHNPYFVKAPKESK